MAKSLALTDLAFMELCAEHEDLRMESNTRGEIELLPGANPLTGRRNQAIGALLWLWARADGRGAAYDSSTLFVLPNGARRSPDASWMSHARAATVPAEDTDRLWHVCPEFVVELRSRSDRGADLHRKMLEWTGNGAELAWLIDADERTVTIYRPGREPEVLYDPRWLAAGSPVEGLTLDLAEVW